MATIVEPKCHFGWFRGNFGQRFGLKNSRQRTDGIQSISCYFYSRNLVLSFDTPLICVNFVFILRQMINALSKCYLDCALIYQWIWISLEASDFISDSRLSNIFECHSFQSISIFHDAMLTVNYNGRWYLFEITNYTKWWTSHKKPAFFLKPNKKMLWPLWNWRWIISYNRKSSWDWIH